MKSKLFSIILCSISFLTSCSNDINLTTPQNTNQVKSLSDDTLSNVSKYTLGLLFQDLDDNKDNKLSSKEVENTINNDKFKIIDKNNDNFLSFDEISSIKNSIIPSEIEMRKYAETKFKMVDSDNNSYIDLKELSKFYKKANNETDKDTMLVLFNLFQQFDYNSVYGNKNNKLEFNEFEDFIYLTPLFTNGEGITKKFPDFF